VSEPINLTQLRHRAEEAALLGDGGLEMEATLALALIDAVEAALTLYGRDNDGTLYAAFDPHQDYAREAIPALSRFSAPDA
jgi:hypothetical protein